MKKQSKVKSMSQIVPSKTDPQGSYTGRPADAYDVPVQDADDL